MSGSWTVTLMLVGCLIGALLGFFAGRVSEGIIAFGLLLGLTGVVLDLITKRHYEQNN